MKRFGLGGLLLALVVSGGCHQQRSPEIDLVLLISIDTLRPDHLGCYGYARPTSPTLDELCREGTVFEQARSHAPSTLLSHAALLTSRPPQELGVSHVRRLALGAEIETLAEVFAASGWETNAWTGGGQLAPEFGLDQGFDGYRVVGDEFTRVVDAFLSWIDQREFTAPAFAFLHTYQVHHPYDTGGDWLASFDAGYRGDLPDRISVELLREINRGDRRLEPGDLDHIEATYDAEIREVDRALGDLVDGLKVRNRSSRTLLVLTSDHGEAFGERGRVGWHSLTLFEEMLSVPLILRGPGVPAGLRVGASVSLIDVAPTLLDLVGIGAPGAYRGRSLVPVFDGVPSALRNHLALGEVERRPPFEAIQRGRWKLYEGQLFDLEADPEELEDVAETHPQVATYLQRRLFENRGGRYSAQPTTLDDETERRLRSLGY